ARDTASAARATERKPLDPKDAKQAAESLRQGDAEDATRRQDKTASDLDQLARKLDEGSRLAKDPREAARQPAHLQEGLSRRTRVEMNRKDAREPLAQRLAPLQKEQEAIRRAAESLSVPPQNRQNQQDKRQAADQAAKAAEALGKERPKEA